MARINADLSGVTDEQMEGGGMWTVKGAGLYRMIVQETDYKPTRAGTGHCLHVKLGHLQPEHAGDWEMAFLTLEHPNPQTVEIARAQLKSLAIAVGHPNPDHVEDSEELHGVPIMVNLGVEAAGDPKYGDRDGLQNTVKGFEPVDGAESQRQEPLEEGGEDGSALEDDGIPF
jgi:hypothetical protein